LGDHDNDNANNTVFRECSGSIYPLQHSWLGKLVRKMIWT